MKMIGNMMAYARNHSGLTLGAIVLVGLVLRIIFFSGIGISDSLYYAAYAYDLSLDNPDYQLTAQSLRLGLLYPVSVLYNLFGVNEFTSNAFPLLLSILSIVLIYFFGKLLFNKETGLIAAALLSIFPLDILYATRLMTDLPSAFFTGLGVYLFLYLQKNKTRVDSLLYILSGASIGVSFLIKELSLLIAFFFGCYVLYKKEIRKQYFLMPLGFFLVFLFEPIYFLLLAGDPFVRYATIDGDWADIVLQTNQYGRGNFPSGWFHYFYFMVTDPLINLFYFFGLIAALHAIVNRRKETVELFLWIIPIVAYISFGTVSFSQYVLIPAASRFLAIITIPLLLLIACFLAEKDKIMRQVIMPGVLIVLVIGSLSGIALSSDRHVKDDTEKVLDYLHQAEAFPLITDQRTVNTLSFLSRFELKKDVKVFDSYECDKTKREEVQFSSGSYVLINHEFLSYADKKLCAHIPSEISSTPSGWKLVKEMKGKNRIDIYYIP